MFNWLPLADHRVESLEALLQAVARKYGYTNVFNPSVVSLGRLQHLAFRAENTPGEKPFRAIYIAISGDEVSTPIDLSETLANSGISQVADPKLVVLTDKVYVTFNSGYSQDRPNELCLLLVWPVVGSPQKCRLEHRQVVEKNWAFFVDEAGELAALYSLSPLVRLRHVGGRLGTLDDLHFDRVESSIRGTKTSLSIGSQLSFLSKNQGFLVAHEKMAFAGKRGYVGRLVSVDFEMNDQVRIKVSSKRLVHSFRKMIPPRRRHNPNLLWATYFAGLVADESGLLLSYGINDLEFGFAKIPMRSVWT